MSNDPAVPSSDLERARALSLRLTRARASSEEPVQSAPLYARFAEPLRRASRIAPPPALNFRALEGAGSSAWHDFLDWTLSVSGGRGAFVVDQDGLTVAYRGAIEPSYLDTVGGRLCLAFDQTAHMRSLPARSESILIELDTEWLNGVRIPVELGGGRLLLGLLTVKPLDLELLPRAVGVLKAAFAD